MFRNVLVLFWLILITDCQPWYTATLLDDQNLAQSSNFKPTFMEGQFEPMLPADITKQEDKTWNAHKSEMTFYPIDERMVEGNFVSTATVPSGTNQLVVVTPRSPENNKSFSKYQKIPTTDPNSKKYNASKKQGYIKHDTTINNINVIKRVPQKRRRIVKRCPVAQPHRKHVRPNRKAKFLDVFQVVQFDNVPCVSSSGLEGICLHEYECKASGSGIAMGECADGYGVCCVCK